MTTQDFLTQCGITVSLPSWNEAEVIAETDAGQCASAQRTVNTKLFTQFTQMDVDTRPTPLASKMGATGTNAWEPCSLSVRCLDTLITSVTLESYRRAGV